MLKKMKIVLLLSFMLTLLTQMFVITSAKAATSGSIIYSNTAEPEPYFDVIDSFEHTIKPNKPIILNSNGKTLKK